MPNTTYYSRNSERLKKNARQYHHDNREKCSARKRAYYLENREKVIEASKRYYKENKISERRKISPLWLRSAYRSGALNRGYNFDLTKKDFMSFWQKPCHYCGDAINTIGIDRIDNTKGYAMNNCVPCCRPCNMGKGELTYAEFIEKAHKIARLHPAVK